ncbi:MAG: DUF4906 domain-containing protein [Muribaculaceae bacterium]|nr:DUF4906 domain-containing protein [Muribaculaceae bacterium]
MIGSARREWGKCKAFSTLCLGFYVALVTLTGCKDDLLYSNSEIEEGLPATVSFTVTSPDMDNNTRTIAGIEPDSEQASSLSDLWVGFFLKSSGEKIKQIYLKEEEFTIEKGNVVLKDIDLSSGTYYIAAVGNVNSRISVKENNDKYDESNLYSDLSSVKNWYDFIKIGVKVDGTKDPVRTTNLVMSGMYSSSSSQKSYSDKLTEAMEVQIRPGTNKLSGKIYLDRLDAYVQVNLYIGKNIEFTPWSWQLCNVPVYSYLIEKSENENLADNLWASTDLDTYFDTAEYESTFFENNFDTSQKFSHFSFDFYQMESKHQGRIVSLEPPSDRNYYNLREKEYKDSEGLNTGYYESLVPSVSTKKSKEMANNNASYLVIKGNIQYYYDGSMKNNKVDYTPVDPSTFADKTNLVFRNADVVYTMHLGNCNGTSTAEQANDFSCKRNNKYIYEITIEDADKLRIEAQGEELQPGAEGIVTDSSAEEYTVDAHYITFNIGLTNNERKNFVFQIEAWYNNEKILIDDESIDEWGEEPGGYGFKKNKFWKWISFIPAESEDKLVPYPGDPEIINVVPGKNDKLFYLDKMSDLTSYPGKKENAEDDEVQYYTVYIDEYVYESSADERSGNWLKYVDQPDRKIWLAREGNESTDKESIYQKTKYYISQRSIQTYYDLKASSGKSIDALGLEHTNETFGLNLRTQTAVTGTNIDEDGRQNCWYFIQDDLNWEYYLNLEKNQDIPATTKQKAYIKEHSEPLPKIKSLGSSTSNEKDPHSITQGDSDTFSVEAMYTCLSRNRDLNGDGQIDLNELRWFVPTSNQMIDVCMARSSLKTPLMDYNGTPKLAGLKGDGGAGNNTRYRFAGSNNKVVWSEQGMVTGPFNNDAAPWEVRCARILGTNLESTGSASPAFELKKLDVNGKTYTAIIPTYYDQAMLRLPQETLPAHSGTNYYNRLPMYGFIIQDYNEYLAETDENGEKKFFIYHYSDIYNNYNDNNKDYLDITEDPQKKQYLLDKHDLWVNEANALARKVYGAGWRVPNQKEVALMSIVDMQMLNKGIIGMGERYIYMSCTYKEYGVLSGIKGEDKTGYFFGIQKPKDLLPLIICNNIVESTQNPLSNIRCVRGITAEEYFRLEPFSW